MTDDLALDELLHYLQAARDAILWKLDGLPDYDVRRPLTPTGSNLLGLVKHLPTVELGYFGECLGRPHGLDLPWDVEDAEDNADMWATPEQSREEILDLYRLAWSRTDAASRELGLTATGRVPWWGDAEVTVRLLLVHMTAETHRHAGHADILRELIDGVVGHRQAVSNLPEHDEQWWQEYVDRLEAAAGQNEASRD